jgi:hypothetical protein
MLAANHCSGGRDFVPAVGSSHGGPENPNGKYAEGVERVAAYARRVLEHAAVLQGQAAALMALVRH